jgi:hypothetical protein
VNQVEVSQWARAKRLSFIVDAGAEGKDAAVAELIELLHELDAEIDMSGFGVDAVATQAVRHLYSQSVLDKDHWPSRLFMSDESLIDVGIPVRSLNRELEGRTTGSRRPCAAHGCPGWFVGVLWESGQQMYICSQGWHYNPTTREIEVIGGGEISARYISPKPLGTPPLPRNEWPSREELLKRRGWR